MKIGSLFSGYGGLDLAVSAVTGADTAWFCEFDKAPSRILAHHWPNVPNHGDITQIQWTPDCPTCGDALALYWTGKGDERNYYCHTDGWFPLSIRDPESGIPEPIEILTGGFPCQDLSHAGKRAGLRPDTRSGLWSHMAYAIDQLRPALVVAENVRGLLSAEAHSDVEPCPWCVGDGGAGNPLRALGAVLGDLADLGYDAAWCGLRAADVGAPHPRFRVFVVAYPHDAGRGEQRWPVAVRTEQRATERTGALLPTPRATDGVKGGPNQRGSSGDLMLPSPVALLPTPAVNDMGEGKTPEAWDEWTAKMQAAHGNGNGHGKSLAIEAQRLLPTPNAGDAKQGYVTREQHDARAAAKKAANLNLGGLHQDLALIAQTTQDWGIYADAIARWEALLTRPAPAPTQLSKKGTPRLSPVFVEWMMGLPAGHVTGVPGISRNDQLKALGNGVVPQQAAAALNYLLTLATNEAAA